jgi:hypothetical protein
MKCCPPDTRCCRRRSEVRRPVLIVFTISRCSRSVDRPIGRDVVHAVCSLKKRERETHITPTTKNLAGSRGNLDSKGFLDRGSYGAFICYTRRGPQDNGPAVADIVVLGKGACVAGCLCHTHTHTRETLLCRGGHGRTMPSTTLCILDNQTPSPSPSSIPTPITKNRRVPSPRVQLGGQDRLRPAAQGVSTRRAPPGLRRTTPVGGVWGRGGRCCLLFVVIVVSKEST